MGIFKKGICCICKKNLNLFNDYDYIKDDIICSDCIDKLKNDGVIFDNERLSDLSISELNNIIAKNNANITNLSIIPNPSIVLKNGEECYYQGEAFSYKTKNIITHYERRGGSAGFRIAKGITIGKTAGISVPIRENIVEKYPGKFYVTNKRIILISEKFGFELNIDKITTVKPYKDALEFYVGGKAYTVLTHYVKYILKICSLAS